MSDKENTKEETLRIYNCIIEDVKQKLLDQSTQGNLQMSESQIDDLQKLWKKKLDELRQEMPKIEKENGTKIQHQQITSKERRQDLFEQHPQKHIKTNSGQAHPVDFDQRQAQQIKEDANEEEIDFIDENQNEKIEDIANPVKEQQALEKYQQTKREQERMKTIFDKVREIKKQCNQAEEEYSESDDPKPNYHIHMYSKKTNPPNQPALSRIKPNKQQKAQIENILIKTKNMDFYYNSAVISFNFKNSKSSV